MCQSANTRLVYAGREGRKIKDKVATGRERFREAMYKSTDGPFTFRVSGWRLSEDEIDSPEKEE